MNLLKIIKEEIDILNNDNKKREISLNDKLMNSLFFGGINEQDVEAPVDNKVRERVIQMINSDQWEESNPSSFKNSLAQSKHKEMLTLYSEGELAQMKLFKLPNLNIGFALKTNEHRPYSEIVAVHNNEPTIKGIGTELMNAAIRNGGCYLDHFDSSKLTNLYTSLGFDEMDRDSYNSEYDPEGSFKSKYGELDVIYRKHRNC